MSTLYSTIKKKTIIYDEIYCIHDCHYSKLNSSLCKVDVKEVQSVVCGSSGERTKDFTISNSMLFSFLLQNQWSAKIDAPLYSSNPSNTRSISAILIKAEKLQSQINHTHTHTHTHTHRELPACLPTRMTPTSWLLGDRTFFMLSSKFSESTMMEDGWGPGEALWEAFSGVLRADGLRLGTRLARDLVTADSTPGFSRLSPLFLMSDSCIREGMWGDG